MRIAATLIVLLIACFSAKAAANCFASTTLKNNADSSPMNTTGATLLVAVVGGGGAPVPGDSANNVWQYTNIYTGGQAGIRISYVPNPITSASDVFTFPWTGILYGSGIVYACSGTTTVYPLASFNGLNTSGTNQVFQSGSVTPVEAGDLIITGAVNFGGGALTAAIDSGFSTPIMMQAGSGGSVPLAAAYLVAPNTSAVNPTWTVNANNTWSSTIAVMKDSGATPPFLGGPRIINFAGNGAIGTTPGGVDTPAINSGPLANLTLNSPGDFAFDAAGNLYFSLWLQNVIIAVNMQATTQTLLNVSIPAGQAGIVAGVSTTQVSFSGDGGAAISAHIAHPISIAIDSSNNLYIADQQNNRIRKVNSSGIISTAVGSGVSTDTTCHNGSYSGDAGPATSATLNCPQGVAVDAAGNLYLSDSSNFRVRAVNMQGTTQTLLGVSIAAGNIATVAGQSTNSFNDCTTGNGGAATAVKLGYPLGMNVANNGDLYIADLNDACVRKISTSGTMSNMGGNGAFGYSGDGGAATSAKMYYPFDVEIASNGDLYVSDAFNNNIRKISSGIITTYAGDYALYGAGIDNRGYGGDGGPALLAGIDDPTGIIIDPSGNVYVADLTNNRVRKILVSGPPSSIGGAKLSQGAKVQ